MVIPKFVSGLIVVLIYLTAALVIRRLLLGALSRAAAKSTTRWDDITIAALSGPLALLIVISTVWVAGTFSGVPIVQKQSLEQVIRVGVVLAILLFLDRFLRTAIDLYKENLEAVHLTCGFARALARLVVLILGSLVILDTLRISITPLLASLGVGGLAIGLALQGTLSNLFAGMQIISDRPIRVGDFIQLESGEEGYVTEIGWRATRIRMLPNNTVIIPNSKLADSVLKNYYLPDQELAVLVNVGVSYDSDLAQVERVTIAVAKAIQETVPGAVPEFEPFIRYHTFDSSSINFTVIMRAREFVDNYLMKHEFIKRLHMRYRQENIVIPFPIRTLDVSEDLLDRLRPLPQ
ncbi:MAG: mechanosensitive ion channel family protein [Acidobacteria bacterium]|nr:mechanosensitive ion channel family protein [Acidobacteriota bacterium]